MADSLDGVAEQCHSPLDFDENRCTEKWRLSRGGLMGILTKIFTWWNGATIGTLWHIFRKGVLVGEDKQGNKFFKGRGQQALLMSENLSCNQLGLIRMSLSCLLWSAYRR